MDEKPISPEERTINLVKSTNSIVTVLLLLALVVLMQAKVSPILLYYFIFLFALNGCIAVYLLLRLQKVQPPNFKRSSVGAAIQILLNFAFAVMCYALVM